MGLESVSALFQKQNFGLLWLRLAVGGLMTFYGLSKFMGGSEVLKSVGGAIERVGIPAAEDSILPMLFGSLAASAELLGGLCLIIGFLFRPAVVAMLGVMVVATLQMYSVSQGDLSGFGHPLLMALVLFGMLWTGPGQYSLQKE